MFIVMEIGFSDTLVLDALNSLLPRPYESPFITISQIVQAMPVKCSQRTVERALIRLENAGRIRRDGPGTKTGYKYEVV
jgi:predicted transcriptional regulator